MSVKVELGFTADGAGGPFFTLDDPVLGKLDDPNVFLGGGEVFVDVSAYFKSFQIRRGKSRELDRYQSGQASVAFDNQARVFDPTFESSPYYGQIVPKRLVRISVDNVIQYEGTVDDWNLEYEPGTNSVATCYAFDSFSYFVSAELGTATYGVETTADRLNNLLDNLNWSQTKRDIAFTGATLAGTAITQTVDALPIMQTVALSEPGDLFIAKDGDVKLVGRNTAFSSSGATFSDTGAGIPYKTIKAIYGSELLYNTVNTTSSVGTATATNTSSVTIYGQRALNQETYLSTTGQLEELAEYLVTRYGNPEYRFEGITVDLRAISSAQRAQVVALELGDVVRVDFTPSKVPPALTRYGKVIGLGLNVTPQSEEVFISLQSTQGSLFVLDDPIFGKLDAGNILGW
jgi:hypothetical protein